jgi:hypothetical protein
MAKYADIISAKKEEKEIKFLSLEAKKAALKLERAILDAGAEVEEAKAELETVVALVPFDIDAVITAKRELADAEEDLADLKAIQTELF